MSFYKSDMYIEMLEAYHDAANRLLSHSSSIRDSPWLDMLNNLHREIEKYATKQKEFEQLRESTEAVERWAEAERHERGDENPELQESEEVMP